MLPLSWLELLEPPAEAMFVVRDAMPEKVHEIVLPGGYRDFTRTTSATVVKVGGMVQGFVKGDRVLLTASVGKCIPLGPTDSVELWRVLPSQVMLKLHERAPAENLGDHPERNYRGGEQFIDENLQFDEGDPLGPR